MQIPSNPQDLSAVQTATTAASNAVGAIGSAIAAVPPPAPVTVDDQAYSADKTARMNTADGHALELLNYTLAEAFGEFGANGQPFLDANGNPIRRATWLCEWAAANGPGMGVDQATCDALATAAKNCDAAGAALLGAFADFMSKAPK